MPRVVQPGGLSQKICVCYTARRKLSLLASAKRIMEEERVSLHRAAEQLQVASCAFTFPEVAAAASRRCQPYPQDAKEQEEGGSPRTARWAAEAPRGRPAQAHL